MEFNDKQKDGYSRAAYLCSRYEKCRFQVQKKLMEWGLTNDEAELVLDRLVTEKFIDDERFVRSFVRDKFRFNKWGKIKIAYQLRAERIPSPVIDEALDDLDDELYRATLFDLMKEKDKSVKAVNQYDRKAKLFRFAQSRGFEMDVISSVFDQLARR